MSRIRREMRNSTVEAIRANGDGFCCTFRFMADFVGFQGHFPGYPVLPAFIQILAAQVAVEEHTGAPLVLRQVKRAKFMKTIRPGDDVHIVWSEEEKDGGLISRVTITASGEKAAVFVLYLGRD